MDHSSRPTLYFQSCLFSLKATDKTEKVRLSLGRMCVFLFVLIFNSITA